MKCIFWLYAYVVYNIDFCLRVIGCYGRMLKTKWRTDNLSKHKMVQTIKTKEQRARNIEDRRMQELRVLRTIQVTTIPHP